jgi:chromosomal replication initiation ATPase DnaA
MNVVFHARVVTGADPLRLTAYGFATGLLGVKAQPPMPAVVVKKKAKPPSRQQERDWHHRQNARVNRKTMENCVPIATPSVEVLQFVREESARSNVPVNAILGRCRIREAVYARARVFLLATEELGISPVKLGRMFKLNHSTVYHAIALARGEREESAL